MKMFRNRTCLSHTPGTGLQFAAAALVCCFAFPAWAQDLSGEEQKAAISEAPPAQPQEAGIEQQARTAASAVGRAGQRQTRDQAAGVAPMARIANRVANRVQNRIRNRIDRNYDPTANATSPFESAEDSARRAGQPRSH